MIDDKEKRISHKQHDRLTLFEMSCLFHGDPNHDKDKQ